MNLTIDEAKEFIRCAQSPVYTIERYGYIQTIDGRRKWEPYLWQRTLLDLIRQGNNVIVLKSRQVGVSWTIAGYVAWAITFIPDFNALLISAKQDLAIKLLNKVRFIISNFPPFIRRDYCENNKTRISLIHREVDGAVISQSSVDSLTTTSESGRGETANFVFCDEFAHIDRAEEVLAAIKPTTSHGGQIVFASSPNGMENAFARLWMQADSGEDNLLVPLRVHWTDCNLSEEWYRRATSGLTQYQILQEYELAFIGTGSPAFEPTHLEACYIPMAEIESNEEYADLRRLIRNSRRFATGVDTAEIRTGKGKKNRDFNAIVSFNEHGIQVGAEANQLLLDEWAGKTIVSGNERIEVIGYVSQWHSRFPGILFIEENGPGFMVYNRHRLPNDNISEVHAVRTVAHTKQRLVDQFRLALAGRQVLITDKATYYQLSVFQDLGGGKFSAPRGFKDDLVMATLLAYDALLTMGGYDFSLPAHPQYDFLQVSNDWQDFTKLPELHHFEEESTFWSDWLEFLPQ